jgi:hypothetical protein
MRRFDRGDTGIVKHRPTDTLLDRRTSMLQLPLKPQGSKIQEIDDFDGRTYRWRPPGGGILRFPIAAFLVFWLCAWAVGWGVAFNRILQGNIPNGARAFLLFWLCLWTVGGAFAFFMLYLLVRPPRAESVTLGNGFFRHDPGSVSWTGFFNPWYGMRHMDPRAFPNLLRRRKRIEIDKSDLGPVVLDRVGERQRLYFDHGADRIEIGEHLREPEREWLAAMIGAWQAS